MVNISVSSAYECVLLIFASYPPDAERIREGKQRGEERREREREKVVAKNRHEKLRIEGRWKSRVE